MTTQLVEHFFRHEYGRLVAMLACRFGVKHIEDVEDAVQSALIAALENWMVSGVPDNPSAWLFRAANNNLFGEFRKRGRRERLLEQHSNDLISPQEKVAVELSGEMQDELLRMMFVSCDESIPVESQVVLALKVLCGFDVREISIRLFTSESNVYKRLGRARARLRELDLFPNELTDQQFVARLPAIQKVLYLLFTEGYLSSSAEEAVRRELCEEAIRLASLLAEHPTGETPETFALIALMHFHSSRLSSRQNELGALLLLEEQDRGSWDQSEIETGMHWLAKAAEGNNFSRYHAEAGIAAEHCRSPSFEETRWDEIAACYELLETTTESPIHRLNRAVAVAEWQGPEAGLAVLKELEPPTWLAGSYLWAAVLADLHRRCGHLRDAEHYRDVAIDSAPTPRVKELLRRRLEAC